MVLKICTSLGYLRGERNHKGGDENDNRKIHSGIPARETKDRHNTAK